MARYYPVGFWFYFCNLVDGLLVKFRGSDFVCYRHAYWVVFSYVSECGLLCSAFGLTCTIGLWPLVHVLQSTCWLGVKTSWPTGRPPNFSSDGILCCVFLCVRVWIALFGLRPHMHDRPLASRVRFAIYLLTGVKTRLIGFLDIYLCDRSVDCCSAFGRACERNAIYLLLEL